MNIKIWVIIPLLLLLLSVVSCKKDFKAPGRIEQFSVKASGYNATYSICVALPEDYDKNRSYSTLYLLDCKDLFNYVSEQCDIISKRYGKENVIVVGIGYGRNRTVDYTPTIAPEGQGGSEAFIEFIKNDLKPRIESGYSADTGRNSRIILGHSFGGLFAAFALTRNNSLFGNYLVLSPSIWYDNEIILQYEQENRSSIQTADQLVFLGIGQMENSGRMQAPFQAFYQRLSTYEHTVLQKNSVPQMEHVGSRNPNILKGLEFYFQNK